MSESKELTVQDNKLQIISNAPEIELFAKAAFKSGLWTDTKSEAQAIIKVMVGRELGFNSIFSMQKLLIVNGQITLMGEAVLAKWKEQGYHWQKIRYNKFREDIDLSDTKDKSLHGVGLLLYDNKGKLLTANTKGEGLPVIFDIDQAMTAQLLGKDNWKKYPERMMFYRAVAFTARDYTPGLISGLLTTEEAQDIEYQEVKVKPAAPMTVSESNITPEDIPQCPIHDVPFKKFAKGRASWWSHILDDGKTWCNKSDTDKLSEASFSENPTMENVVDKQVINGNGQGQSQKTTVAPPSASGVEPSKENMCPVHDLVFEDRTSKKGQPYKAHDVDGWKTKVKGKWYKPMCYPNKVWTPSPGDYNETTGEVFQAGNQQAQPEGAPDMNFFLTVTELCKDLGWDMAKGEKLSVYLEEKFLVKSLDALGETEKRELIEQLKAMVKP